MGTYGLTWTTLASALANKHPDTALHFILRLKRMLVPVRDLADQNIPSLEVPSGLEAALEDAHDLKCPITLEILVDPCGLDGKVCALAICCGVLKMHRDWKPCPIVTMTTIMTMTIIPCP